MNREREDERKKLFEWLLLIYNNSFGLLRLCLTSDIIPSTRRTKEISAYTAVSKWMTVSLWSLLLCPSPSQGIRSLYCFAQ